MWQVNVEVVRALLPSPDTDIAAIFREERLFEATRAALTPLFGPAPKARSDPPPARTPSSPLHHC